MSLNEQYFDKASAQLEDRRRRNKATEQLRHDEVCAKLPEYAKLETLLSDTSRKLITIMIQDKDNAAEKLSQLEQSNLTLQKSMSDLLVQGGFPEDYLEPVYTCKNCRDKGYADGKWCECFIRLMLDEAAKEMNSVSPLKLSTFDSFKTEYYSDTFDSTLGTSPRTIMSRNLEFCKSYADSFTEKSDSVFMTGGTGLGKTHLSLAIADAVIKKGYNVIYGSAPELLRVMEREYFGRADSDTMDALTKCDLLIFDDLGAEMDKPLYSSLIYELMNARISRGLPTIISTNLGENELNRRYQDRILSRMLSFEVLMFAGTDIRRKISR
ncbi:MAG: DNA replication protein [Ruminococcaceae bacterium]|nr:DNA replication protein [Oscillospiraceae bacterium]